MERSHSTAIYRETFNHILSSNKSPQEFGDLHILFLEIPEGALYVNYLVNTIIYIIQYLHLGYMCCEMYLNVLILIINPY